MVDRLILSSARVVVDQFHCYYRLLDTVLTIPQLMLRVNKMTHETDIDETDMKLTLK